MKNDTTLLGNFRKLAVKRFQTLECSLRVRLQSKEFADAAHEQFDMGHAKLVPVADLRKPCNEVFYFVMQMVCKEMSSIYYWKVRVKFNPSSKTVSSISLSDHLLVGPMVHPMMIDILLGFRRHLVALTTDVTVPARVALYNFSLSLWEMVDGGSFLQLTTYECQSSLRVVVKTSHFQLG